MPLPNFIVIGAPKAGTTTLWALLKQHSDVFMCDPKEPEFFSRDDIYSRGLGWYEKLFEAVKTEIAVGEATTAYSRTQTFPHVAERMAETLPEARLIYIARDPVERLKSDWLWHLHRADVRNTGRWTQNLTLLRSITIRTEELAATLGARRAYYWLLINVHGVYRTLKTVFRKLPGRRKKHR